MIAQRWKFLCVFWLGLLLAAAPARAQKSNAEALVKQADEAFNQGYDPGKNSEMQSEIAIDRLEFAVAADPQSLIARLQLAYLYVDSFPMGFRQMKERREFVLKTYQDALSGDPANPVLLWDMAVAEFQAHHFDEARDWMKKFLAVDPNSRKGNFSLAAIALNLVDNPLRAARQSAKASSSGADSVSEPLLRAGLARKYLPVINEGIEAARKVLSLKNEDMDGLIALRSLLYVKSTVLDPAAAISVSSEIAALEPRMDAARKASSGESGSSSGSPIQHPQLNPGEPPPPADERFVLLPAPPPPPAPPSTEHKGPEPPYKDLDADDQVIETRNIPPAVHPNRAFVLWMGEQTKHDRGPLTPDNPYTCQDHSLGSYNEGSVYLSLADTKTRTFINTVELRDPNWIAASTEKFKLPYRIAPDPYQVKGELTAGEGTPEFLHPEDYNGDGQPIEVAFFNVKDCVETEATILGYSPKQDKVIRYRFILEKEEASGGGYLNSFWIANLTSQKPDDLGHWKYEIDRRAADGFMEVIELHYDPAQEVFRGTISKK
ncbi:MAG TPA: hypothetical protein VKH15_19070 [Candidatus Acidoferrum sp.]|nr:hypothetical protein [Candidatus Acidoferrum sp.]